MVSSDRERDRRKAAQTDGSARVNWRRIAMYSWAIVVGLIAGFSFVIMLRSIGIVPAGAAVIFIAAGGYLAWTIVAAILDFRMIRKLQAERDTWSS